MNTSAKAVFSGSEITLQNNTHTCLKTTSSFCNKRKQQGIFICRIDNLDYAYYVLLSSLDENIIQNNCEFHLGYHKFPGTYYPSGNKYICEVATKPFISSIYCMGPIKIKKDVILAENEQRLMICYTLLESNATTQIHLQPFLAYRSIHQLSKSNNFHNFKYKNIKNGKSLSLYSALPELFIQFSKSSSFIINPDWYYNFEYINENNPDGYDYEDLFVPGFFKIEMEEGERVIFTVGLHEIEPINLMQNYISEIENISHYNKSSIMHRKNKRVNNKYENVNFLK
jgi:predicted glycogen debranching enzyme